MREIKFRAWDEKRKLMTVFNLREIEADCCGNVAFLRNTPHQHENDFWEDFKLMQFVGVVDSRGKEIFEGDIVNIKANPKDYGGYKGHNYIATVEWNSDELCYDLSDGHGLKDFEFIKVIGNIYENKDLLTE